jgi:hypothetical protein
LMSSVTHGRSTTRGSLRQTGRRDGQRPV